MQNKRKFIGIILNMFDGPDAGGTGGEGDGSATGSVEIKPEVRARGKALGVPDDLLEDYQNAFYGGDDSGSEGAEQNEEDNNTEAGQDEDLNAEFEELIKGKYKDAFHQRVGKDISERVTRAKRDMADLEARTAKSDRVMALLAEKYGDSDPDRLYDAIRGDNELWRQQALDKGQTAEEFMQSYDNKVSQQEQQAELEALRQYKAANELDMRLQGLARETQKQYPDFDLRSEFANPKFRAALDFVAAQNEAKNKQAGTSDEVFDLTFAYEMAHSDELRANQIKRVGKATASAVAQTMQANRERPRENAARQGAQTKAKSVDDMSDEEFDAFVEKIRRGEAHLS